MKCSTCLGAASGANRTESAEAGGNHGFEIGGRLRRGSGGQQQGKKNSAHVFHYGAGRRRGWPTWSRSRWCWSRRDYDYAGASGIRDEEVHLGDPATSPTAAPTNTGCSIPLFTPTGGKKRGATGGEVFRTPSDDGGRLARAGQVDGNDAVDGRGIGLGVCRAVRVRDREHRCSGSPREWCRNWTFPRHT